MLEEKDLQAIAEMMKGMESRIDQKLEKQKQDIMHDVKVLLDTEVTTRFNLLAEGQRDYFRETGAPGRHRGHGHSGHCPGGYGEEAEPRNGEAEKSAIKIPPPAGDTSICTKLNRIG